MKTNSEHQTKDSSGQPRQRKRKGERGNALVYVLIAIALFAALSFTLSRNADTGEAGTLSEDRAKLYMSQIVSYAAQAKSVYDQMNFQGIRAGEVDFTTPDDSTFNDNEAGGGSADRIRKIYHPDGGGLNVGNLPIGAIEDSGITTPGDPEPGWYMGRFNNFEWTALSAADVDAPIEGKYEEIVLTAYGIDPVICAMINQTITSSTDIPSMGDSIKETLIEDTHYTSGSNTDLTTETGTPICAECNNQASLCVEEGGIYAFYTVIAAQ